LSKVIQIQNYVGLHNTQYIHEFTVEFIEACNLNTEITLRTHEGFCPKRNGMYDIVLWLCNRLNVDPSIVTFENNNFKQEDLFPFNHKICKGHLLATFFYRHNNDLSIECGEGKIAQFMSAWRPERLEAYWQLKNFSHKNKFVSSFNSNNERQLTDFPSSLWVLENSDKFANIINDLPYSDIDETNENDGISFLQSLNWKSIYKNIGLEIVLETMSNPGFFITEKTIRPILFGKPFLIIGSPSFEKNLKDMGFYIFDDLIDKGYDEYGGVLAVQNVYNSVLPQIIENNIIEEIFKNHKDKLEHNQNLMVEFCSKTSHTTIQEIFGE